MKIRSFLAAAAVCGALLLPGAASAESIAFAIGTSNMRAGPGTNFPVIAQIAGGSQVNVLGCLSNYSWCDSVVQGYRGWVSTTRLEFAYAGRRVLVPQYSAYFDVPFIGFDFGYWDDHYRDRSFYRDRGRWDDDWRDGPRRRDRDRYGDRDRDRDRDRDIRFGDDQGQVFSDRGNRRRDREPVDGFDTQGVIEPAPDDGSLPFGGADGGGISSDNCTDPDCLN